VSPDEVTPAISRLQMLAASAEADDAIEAVQDALSAFDDERSQRELVRVMTAAVAAKIPVGGHLHVTDAADLAAIGLLQAAEIFDRRTLVELVDDLPEENLPDLAAALVVFWNHACEQAAARTLANVTIPKHPEPKR
jgi:hypothetical protein